MEPDSTRAPAEPVGDAAVSARVAAAHGARLRLLAVGLTEDECKAAVAGSARAALYPAEVPPCASRT